MSKYDKLWQWIVENGKEKFFLTYDDIEKILEFPIDHSFLTYKKELMDFGYKAEKISMKESKIFFVKMKESTEKGRKM